MSESVKRAFEGVKLFPFWLDISRKGPSYIPPEPLRWIAAKITFNAFDGADDRGGWRRLWIDSIKALGFPM